MCESQIHGVHHLILSVNFANGFLAMIETFESPATLYFDDSGTHEDSLVAIAAAYIINVDQLGSFTSDWINAQQSEGFDVFHMASFNAHQEEFAHEKWKDDSKRKRTLDRLIGICNIRSRYCVAVAVDKKAYESLILPDPILARICGGYPYTFSVLACLDAIYKWREKFCPGVNLRYVFDQMSRGKGEIIRIFDEYKYHPFNPFGMIKAGYSFESKEEVLQLQGADILAWHMYQQMSERVLRGLPVRPETHALMKTPNRTRWFDKEGLSELCIKLREHEMYKNPSRYFREFRSKDRSDV